MKEKKKKKEAFGLDRSDSLLQPPLIFSFLFPYLPPSTRVLAAAVLAQSNPATGSEPEFDARNRTPFVSQACSEALCTCHT